MCVRVCPCMRVCVCYLKPFDVMLICKLVFRVEDISKKKKEYVVTCLMKVKINERKHCEKTFWTRLHFSEDPRVSWKTLGNLFGNSKLCVQIYQTSSGKISPIWIGMWIYIIQVLLVFEKYQFHEMLFIGYCLLCWNENCGRCMLP